MTWRKYTFEGELRHALKNRAEWRTHPVRMLLRAIGDESFDHNVLEVESVRSTSDFTRDGAAVTLVMKIGGCTAEVSLYADTKVRVEFLVL